MHSTRDGAIRRARAMFDDGAFPDRLCRLVAVPTESFPSGRKPDEGPGLMAGIWWDIGTQPQRPS